MKQQIVWTKKLNLAYKYNYKTTWILLVYIRNKCF